MRLNNPNSRQVFDTPADKLRQRLEWHRDLHRRVTKMNAEVAVAVARHTAAGAFDIEIDRTTPLTVHVKWKYLQP